MYWSASFLARSGNSSSLLDPATSIRTLSPPSPLSSLGTPAARNKTGWGVNCGLIPHPIRPRSPRGYSVAEADKGRSKHEPRSDRPEPLIDRVSSGRLDHLDGPRLDLHPAHLLRGCWFVVDSAGDALLGKEERDRGQREPGVYRARVPRKHRTANQTGLGIVREGPTQCELRSAPSSPFRGRRSSSWSFPRPRASAPPAPGPRGGDLVCRSPP